LAQAILVKPLWLVRPKVPHARDPRDPAQVRQQAL